MLLMQCAGRLSVFAEAVEFPVQRCRGARYQELPPQYGLARMSDAQQIKGLFVDFLRYQMSGDLPAWYRPTPPPAAFSLTSNRVPVPFDVLKRQHDADLERMLQAAEQMPEGALLLVPATLEAKFTSRSCTDRIF